MKFKTNDSLYGHRLTHNEKRPFHCEVCGVKFKRKGDLKGHKIRHIENRTEFECVKCKKTFLTLKSLKRHELSVTHLTVRTTEKPFKCDLCDDRFSFNNSMKRHMRNQHKESD